MILALVGVGKWGSNYLETAKNIKEVNLKYICSNNFNQSNSSYTVVKELSGLLKYKDIDGVIVATPASTHFEIGKIILDSGFNLLLEKPMTLSYKEAQVLAKIAKRKKRVLMVGHIYLYNPAFSLIKKYLKDLGDIRYFFSEGMGNGPIRVDTTALWDWAPHDLSMILEIIRQKPLFVSAFAYDKNSKILNSYNFYHLELEFKKNIKAFINVSCSSQVKKRSFTIFGSKAIINFNDIDVKKKLTLIKNNKISFPHVSNRTPLEMELRSFCELIKEKKSNSVNIDQSSLIIKIIELCEKSIMKGNVKLKVS